MRWFIFFNAGLFGLALVSKVIRIHFSAAAWVVDFGWMVFVPFLVLAGISFEWWGRPMMQGIDGMKQDAEAFSLRKCGAAQGWVYQAVKWFCVVWIAPLLWAVISLFPASE